MPTPEGVEPSGDEGSVPGVEGTAHEVDPLAPLRARDASSGTDLPPPVDFPQRFDTALPLYRGDYSRDAFARELERARRVRQEREQSASPEQDDENI